MSNAGLFHGLAPNTWRDYVPRLRGLNPSGAGITQPIIIDPRRIAGRFLITNQGLVKVQGQIAFAAGDTIGTGDTFYGISLPFPANRSSGGTDLPIGQMFLDQGAAANPRVNMIGQATLADPGQPGVSQGAEDYFFQGFIRNHLSFGTAAIPSGSTSVTVNHLQIQTPLSYDFNVVPTNTPTTNPQWVTVQNIGATTFDIVVKVNPSTSGATFAWKIEAEPNAGVRVSSGGPWAWAAGHAIGWNIQYEARR